MKPPSSAAGASVAYASSPPSTPSVEAPPSPALPATPAPAVIPTPPPPSSAPAFHNRVQSLNRAGELDAASATARHVVFSSTRPTVFTCNADMPSMLRAGRLDDAFALHAYFFTQSNFVSNVVSFNTHCDTGHVETASVIFRHIIANAPFSPSSVNQGNYAEANEVFHREGKRLCMMDVGCFNNIFGKLCEQGMIAEAEKLFAEMRPISFTAAAATYGFLIDGFLKEGRVQDALDYFDKMVNSGDSGPKINLGFYNKVFDELVNAGFLRHAVEIFSILPERGLWEDLSSCRFLP